MRTSHQLFLDVHAVAQHSVDFSLEWNNGTGYLDGAVHAELPTIPVGEYFSFTTTDNNRKGVILPTPLGNVVVFERRTEGSGGIIVSNRDQRTKAFCRNPSGAMQVEDLEDIFMYGKGQLALTIQSTIADILALTK